MTKEKMYDSLNLGDKMISKIILEDVLDEMIENVCYAKLKVNIIIKKNSNIN